MAGARSDKARRIERPLSPHLQVYSPLVNMVMSILHRMTGAALYFGTLLLAWWLVAAATGPEYFAYVNGIFSSWPGLLVLFGYTWALFHHMAGGLRHFIWDTGRGYDLKTIDILSWGTLAVSALATIAVWIWGLGMRGGLAP
jgi:succinate dehydrogenase / fumarate reductase cytochrome b subunit